ncbi:MAG TPA: excinuclease ABC subunit UvrA [Dyella sp.]|nr:excinuclease ABC subunit UvrA [Dyella sp.]
MKTGPGGPAGADNGCVRVRGAREHNLKNLSVDIPRDALVVFTGVSGSGKSSLAFGTVYAEAQRRYFESVAPYARRLIEQAGVPAVDRIDGLPPAVALQQSRGGGGNTRSTVGSLSTLSNALRMLYSRAGDYPPGLALLESDAFSPNTPAGACPDCHGLGKVFDATEDSMVPDPSLTIRERAVACWPQGWQGKNYRDILTTLGYDVDRPWRELPREQRDWILFTDEQPVVPVYRDVAPAVAQAAYARGEPGNYKGTYVSARAYVMHSFAQSESAAIKQRVARYMVARSCPACDGRRLRPEALSVTFGGHDIAHASGLPLRELARHLRATLDALSLRDDGHPEKQLVAARIVADVGARIDTLVELGLGYLSLERSTPTLSPGELQRLRLATQLQAQLFGVVYVLDEPSAGLHPADTEALLRALARLKAGGNSLFVVEHELDVIRAADWVVDIGPGAGTQGGEVLHAGPLAGLADCAASATRRYVFDQQQAFPHTPREPSGWLRLEAITRNNVDGLDVAFPLGAMTAVTGVSGAGKSSLVSQALVELVGRSLGTTPAVEEGDELPGDTPAPAGGRIVEGMDTLTRLVTVDQRPIGRTPRSNLATYTGLFDHVRKLFAATPEARKRKFDAGRFSFNVAKGRCATCEGEGFVSVGLLFLPSVYAPCPTCHGSRYNDETLAVTWNGRTIAGVLALTVDDAVAFFGDEVPALTRSLVTLRDVGLGYLRLGQPATELSGGEAQRIKLATELQRQARGHTLYVLDEPTTGLHPADVDRLMVQLHGLVAAGHSVVLVEHDRRVITACDWMIDLGPGAGDEGGCIVAQGTPAAVSAAGVGVTARHLAG